MIAAAPEKCPTGQAPESPVAAVDRAMILAKCAGTLQALQLVVPLSDTFAPARWLERALVGDQP